MAKQTTVKLGGKDYTITEKPMGQANQWRTKLRSSRVVLIFESLDQAIAQIVRVGDTLTDGGWSDVDLAQVIGVARILPIITNGLLNSIDEVWGLVFDYAPDIAADREWLEENAYDEEGIAALIAILQMAFPITALWGLVSGRKAQQTPPNSPTRNGKSGLSPSGPARKNSKTSS